MRVIVIASQKGGSGKTTLTGHLAVQAVQQNAGPVAVIDTDPQGSLAEWWNQRDSASPYFVSTTLAELEDDLAALEDHGAQLAIIDTPPAITHAIQRVVSMADMVIIPIRPSPHDLRAAAATVELVEDLDRQFVFVVNGASPRARITGDSAVTLSQYGTVAPVTVHQRTDFATSMIGGGTVMERNPKSRSTEEIGQLWGYLAKRLERVAQRSVTLDPLALDPSAPELVMPEMVVPELVMPPSSGPHLVVPQPGAGTGSLARGEPRLLRPAMPFGRRHVEESRP